MQKPPELLFADCAEELQQHLYNVVNCADELPLILKKEIIINWANSCVSQINAELNKQRNIYINTKESEVENDGPENDL